MTYRKKSPLRPNPSAEVLFTSSETAQLLGISPQTLAHWRVRGTSPKYLVLNPRCIRYRASDVLAWLEARSQESTAENGQGDRP
ncbi:helix-turn-helix transcriptional regulator [Nitrospirillum sp. BR 11828]|uniref:helix-turn-helix transcriptional regulator n=1 Tax=Nitrospirillum sp. BR 11828 TaxID=3104325 RepID=UPI003A100DDF